MQTLGAISESIKTRHCTAASYTIRWDTGPRGVYLSTEPVSRRLAASASKPDCTSAFPPLRWAASGQRQVKEASGGQRYTGSDREQPGRARPLVRGVRHWARKRISLSVTISAFFRIAFWPAWLSPRMRLSSPDHAPLIARTRVLAICSFCRFSSYNTASGRFYQPGETFMTHLTYSRLCCFFFFFFFFFKY